MQRRHSVRSLLWRGGVAAVSNVLMFSGAYPLLIHALRRTEPGDHGIRPVRAVLAEWGLSAVLSALRPAGFFALPGGSVRGPRPVIMLHGYAMNRANFVPLAYRLARAGLGPITGFEYSTLGRIADAARRLGAFVDEVRRATGAEEVDLIGHSMGGIVARYFVTFGGGDGIVNHLVTLGSPHRGTDVSKLALGHATRELVIGSKLVHQLADAPPLVRTRILAIWSRGDALVPGALQDLPGAEILLLDDLGHVSLLGSRRVAREIITRLGPQGT